MQGARKVRDSGDGAQPGPSASPSGSRAFENTGASVVGLYATPSISSLLVEPEDLEPGPGSYDTEGGFGYQPLSTHHSQPALTLTARHDHSWDRAMITKDHLNAIMARGTPGPGTYQNPQKLPSQARVRFGTSKRDAGLGFRAPGPEYNVISETGGEQRVKVKFGRAHRFDAGIDTLSNAPGPGQYESQGGFNGAGPSKTFGVSHRAYDRVVFPGSERLQVGQNSPGPGKYTPFQNSGRQNGFGTAPRMAPNGAAKRAPGPGAYDTHEKAPPAIIASQSCYSMGRPPAKGRLDLKSLKAMSSSTWGMY